MAQSEESLAALEREAERLDAEMRQARNELESLGVQSGQAQAAVSSRRPRRLKRLESEIAELREALQARRAEENAAARAGESIARRTGFAVRPARIRWSR